MDRAFQIYDAICSVCEAIDGFAESTLYSGENDVTKELGIPNFDKAYNAYYEYLYDLYDLAVKENVLNEVLGYIESDECSDFKEVCEEYEYEAKQAEHEDLMYSVEVGDKVRLFNGNEYYVADIDGNSIWVTNDKSMRNSIDARGWSAQLSDVVEILEKYNEL